MKYFFKSLFFIIACFLTCSAILFNSRSLVFDNADGYTLYLGNTGSDCKIEECSSDAAWKKLLSRNIRGEEASYHYLDVKEFLQKYEAQIIFTEIVADTQNFYCYSPKLGEAIELYGKAINLHVAVKEDGVKVGTPIIFGGY